MTLYCYLAQASEQSGTHGPLVMMGDPRFTRDIMVLSVQLCAPRAADCQKMRGVWQDAQTPTLSEFTIYANRWTSISEA
jgi:hypothetical protein